MEATPSPPRGGTTSSMTNNMNGKTRQRGSTSVTQTQTQTQQPTPHYQQPQYYSSSSSSQPQHYYATQNHQHQLPTNNNNNTHNQYAYPPPGYRLGGHGPYRDDPQVDPSVLLESFTPNHNLPDEKPKELPLSRRLCATVASWSRTVCQPTTTLDSHSNYYQDDFNDLSWACCRLGTDDDHGVWLNRYDPAGTMMSLMVWFLIGYSAVTMTFLAQTGGIPAGYALAYQLVACLALASHAKTSLTDPGAVPASAVPTERQRLSHTKLSMCSQCQTFKPPQSHHCRICNRCISRMDHHCPWMNNCVGAANMKHFVLFLIYTWLCSGMSLLLLGWNYFFCASEDCTFTVVLVQLVRIMTLLSIGAFLFTSSMIMNVCYGLMTGVGTIDRLKKKASNSMEDSDEDQIPLTDVFGIGSLWTWFLPTDPVFDDYDRVMGYSTPQRLLREQMLAANLLRVASNSDTFTDTPSVMSRDSFGIPFL